MPVIIPQIIKDEIFQSWLSGSFRKATAVKHGVSEASVSNIMAERRLQHSSNQLNELRALSLAMNRSGLSIQECVDGHRTAMIMRKLGVDEDRFEDFISKLWQSYVSTGLNPEILEKQANELYHFLEENNGLGTGVSIIRICDNINTLKSEEATLNTDIAGLKSDKNELEKSISELHVQKSKVKAELGFNTEFIDKLRANGFENGEILKCLNLALSVKKSGHSFEEAIEKFSTCAKLDETNTTLRQEVIHQEVRHNYFLKVNASHQELYSKNSLKLSELEDVKGMGFGLLELKRLRHMLKEVEEQCELFIGPNTAVKKFLTFSKIITATSIIWEIRSRNCGQMK
jgi:hypothetical protein